MRHLVPPLQWNNSSWQNQKAIENPYCYLWVNSKNKSVSLIAFPFSNEPREN